MRYQIRELQFKDIPQLVSLAKAFPLCSLPPNRSQLEEKVVISKKSFDKSLKPFKRNYIFVLEDRQKKQVIASSQILSYFGDRRSLCYFLDKSQKYLQLKAVSKGRHQLGGLILNPTYRKAPQSLGLLIGLARFLYIKHFPKDFSKKIEVSLTPPLRQGGSDFWRETGEVFLKKNYAQARKAFQNDREAFLQSFPKKLKIPVQSLSLSAQKGLSQVHPQTQPIYKGLLKRGFYKTGAYHLLDGGLYLEAQWQKLPFLKRSQNFKLHYDKKTNSTKAEDYLLAQQKVSGFVCLLVKAQKKGRALILKKNPVLEPDKQVLALKSPF